MENRLICICGPTASGKTALSVALAEQLDTEIISADSMQLYHGMDIGTAKPTAEERRGIPHHLIDVCEPGERFSVARYVELADVAAQQLLASGHIPVVVGGTGLYMDALIECSVFTGDETDLAVRIKYQQLAEKQGNAAVHAALRQVDPEAAGRLHPNNLKRVIRALEVFEQTGLTLDEFNRRNKRIAPKYDAVKIGVCPVEREVLYERIDRRVEQMLEDGLLQETQRLLDAGKLIGTAAQAIGYKELLGYLQGQEPLDACVKLLKQRSRNYAKRQLTWLKRDDKIHWIYYNKHEELETLRQKATDYLVECGVQ
ncbi:tRNA (adenosine(37)-N6)-dimethylallyltransferase MiaA [Agathobaculum sp.]|uniref:tRNA (adenosine(37)-N6)-dimethylallyltransferase MiaA n=1 Tax=Agathobaculum sp. TaxID=2048138 RepID=UPI002A827E83|nr:tRNA (adenosine(37)-N6)-dimethylallyltransferase MiaA [Agathobaculum sp.]MDY3618077.1 tRNA (adenosine(37)-N6)-dimethylallyltransferase MiaA [Agathobaculum sp.]